MLTSSQQYIELFSQPNPDFSQFTNVPGLETFIQQNKEQLELLCKNHKVVSQILAKFIDPAKDSLVNLLDGVDVDQSTEKIIMREKKQTEIFDDINQRFGDKFTDFEDKVSKTCQSLDKLRGLAVGLNANGFPLNTGGGGGIDKVIGALNFFLVRIANNIFRNFMKKART